MNKGKLYRQALAEMESAAPDIARAHELLKMAVDKGDVYAAYALATWHLFGQAPVLRRNARRAVPLLQIAAEAGMALAEFDLAVCFEKGAGIHQDQRMAAKLYLRAALHGDAGAHYEVGRCYHFGIGFARDEEASEIWLDRAKALGVEAEPDVELSKPRRRSRPK